MVFLFFFEKPVREVIYNRVDLHYNKARFFLLVDLREFFSDLGSGDEKKINEKAHLIGHFHFFFFFF